MNRAAKWYLFGAVLFVLGFLLVLSQTPGCKQTQSHLKSGIIGLHRTITIYANDGTPIKSWTTKTKVEELGGTFRFLIDGKAVQLSGTVIIEEQP